MRVIAFDINTKFTGLWVVEEDKDGNILEIHTATLIVDDFKVKDHTEYMESKKQLPYNKTHSGVHNTYYKKGETYVSKKEKELRDREVRHKRNNYQILKMSTKFSETLRMVKPDVVILERNEMFRGIMTIEVLAKLNGTLLGECAHMGIPYEQFSVNAIREPYNIPRLIKQFSEKHTPEFIASRSDLSKAAIADFLEEKYKTYGVKFSTYDESDAGLAYDFWKNHKHKNKRRV